MSSSEQDWAVTVEVSRVVLLFQAITGREPDERDMAQLEGEVESLVTALATRPQGDTDDMIARALTRSRQRNPNFSIKDVFVVAILSGCPSLRAHVNKVIDEGLAKNNAGSRGSGREGDLMN